MSRCRLENNRLGRRRRLRAGGCEGGVAARQELRVFELQKKGLHQSGATNVRLRDNSNVGLAVTDKADVRQAIPEMNFEFPGSITWAMRMKAVSSEEPMRLSRMLMGAILGCGAWMLSHTMTDAGRINVVFEFERGACLDIYSVLIAAGVELSPLGHRRMTELCQCTRHRRPGCGEEFASVELEIYTFQQSGVLSGASGAGHGVRGRWGR